MKTLTESIRDRRGWYVPETINKSGLKTGYIIKYRKSGVFAMYFDYNWIEKNVRNVDKFWLQYFKTYGGFLRESGSTTPVWMPVNEYYDNLKHKHNSDWDVVEVYPYNNPELMDLDRLKKLASRLNPIKIN